MSESFKTFTAYCWASQTSPGFSG